MKSFIIPSFIQNSKENSRFVKIFKTWYLKQKRFSLKSIKKVNFILWLISPLGKSEELPDHKKTKTFQQFCLRAERRMRRCEMNKTIKPVFSRNCFKVCKWLQWGAILVLIYWCKFHLKVLISNHFPIDWLDSQPAEQNLSDITRFYWRPEGCIGLMSWRFLFNS